MRAYLRPARDCLASGAAETDCAGVHIKLNSKFDEYKEISGQFFELVDDAEKLQALFSEMSVF